MSSVCSKGGIGEGLGEESAGPTNLNATSPMVDAQGAGGETPWVLGIDIGFKGGFCLLHYGLLCKTWQMPLDNGWYMALGISDIFADVYELTVTDHVQVVMETPQHVMTNALGTASLFHCGGLIRGIHTEGYDWCWSFDEVAPRRWQKVMLPEKMNEKDSTKKRAIRKFKDLFGVKPETDGIADAGLIAKWWIQYWKGVN